MDENLNILVEDLSDDVEDIVLTYDRRLDLLSEPTRLAIMALFECNLDEAEYAATRAFQTYRQPPAWAIEIHGASRQGWKEWV